MNYFLVALGAGLISAGAAVGAAMAGLIPTQNTESQDAKVAVSTTENPDLAARLDRLEKNRPVNTDDSELVKLNERLKDLEDSVNAKDDEIALLRKQIANLKVAPTSKVEGEGANPVATSPEFDAAWEARYEAKKAQEVEERRLERQAQLLKDTEDRKTRTAEFMPDMIKRMAERMNIPETVIPNVSDAMVAHVNKRLDINFKISSAKIDDKEVDDEAIKLERETLDAETVTALSSLVDEETAKNLVNMSNRMSGGRGGTRGGNFRRGR